MPSPFPGMDPYFESDLWTGFHREFTVEVRRHLIPLLSPRYYPYVEKWMYTASEEEIGIEERDLYPDVAVVRHTNRPLPISSKPDRTAPLVLELPTTHEISQNYLEIRDVKKKKLVTVIELLSPSNKAGKGREEYLNRRNSILNSPVHLIELDLLRRGRRLPMKGDLPRDVYYAMVSRANLRPRVEVWPAGLFDPLPTISIPLQPGDDDVYLNLQTCFDQFYELGRFDLTIDYHQPLPIRVSLKEQKEVVKRLKSKKATS